MKLCMPSRLLLPLLYTVYRLQSAVQAQLIGSFTPENHPPLTTFECNQVGGCSEFATSVVLDANWRWLHKKDAYDGCPFNSELCPDPATCAQSCAIEGANYEGTYGIKTKDTALSLQFVTVDPYGTNVGSRTYLLEDHDNYKQFKLLNKEFTFDVDVSQLPCGLNGALYFVEMQKDGGKSDYNATGASYGTGYCDAQCPRDIKFIRGGVNTNAQGSCCSEFDVWEANSMANAFTTHACDLMEGGAHPCTTPEECGEGESWYKGLCDRDGCDFNPFRVGDRHFYGPGKAYKLDSTQPFTVVTQFITSDGTDDGDLVEIKRFYVQNNRRIWNPKIDIAHVDPLRAIMDHTCAQTKRAFDETDANVVVGGLKRMGEALKRGVVLTMSIWADDAHQMQWLDGTFKDGPGSVRGLCGPDSGKSAELQAQVPNASVTFANIRVGCLDSTTSGV